MEAILVSLVSKVSLGGLQYLLIRGYLSPGAIMYVHALIEVKNYWIDTWY